MHDNSAVVVHLIFVLLLFTFIHHSYSIHGVFMLSSISLEGPGSAYATKEPKGKPEELIPLSTPVSHIRAILQSGPGWEVVSMVQIYKNIWNTMRITQKK